MSYQNFFASNDALESVREQMGQALAVATRSVVNDAIAESQALTQYMNMLTKLEPCELASTDQIATIVGASLSAYGNLNTISDMMRDEVGSQQASLEVCAMQASALLPSASELAVFTTMISSLAATEWDRVGGELARITATHRSFSTA